ncbi:hypothetical protein RE735_01345 [Bacillus aerius]|uniref:hypothetical protein n=1 Tax=Bacillus aerius TaxID=293388 RepID=UPI0028155EA8|nr:hypothetical protein [Bacillus aerius]WMT29245.1 hypothetical protein RE735_01345 [Bacillus aerius]
MVCILKDIREIITSLFEKQSKTEAEQLLKQKVEDIQKSIQELKKRKAAIQLLTKQTLVNCRGCQRCADIFYWHPSAPSC